MSKQKLCMILSAFYCCVETKKKLRNHERLFCMTDYFLPFKFVLESSKEEHKIISGLPFTPSNFFVNLLSVPSLDSGAPCVPVGRAPWVRKNGNPLM